ncbi:aldo/keto reductase [Mycobacteroides abscessus]|uniref:aldo/keto reductase n=1 Tax=Mycobacteroides abscessus TaxID=36809 RepID=UPI0009A5A158|nr:aldo/keto reductase [Mycobacteroides abscessus]SKG48877.1 aldo/keto reductase [Mycobacteroides abscessus subsp. massiliense]SKH53360.1 aldo/keto reductase [Mycobacteroides abscessus subsp. massiliense]SKH96229.1 aldo/keto reductase [Mycobacteroides abscessus subsp. massiliense]SKI92356.1 aldo/keto reductase [Mycobacteroides abscessus subsp. massiliense]SKJ46171.1 aldo/keto reductase [Mycobacteroides abscessus subsp. massiliense]
MKDQRLGLTDIRVSPIGLGTAQFSGKGWIAALTPTVPQDQIDGIVKTALDGGITWFDSSEMYGGGTSERALASALVQAGVAPGEVVVATKWVPVGRTARSIEKTIGDRIDALAPFPIDLHQVHLNRGGLSSVRAQMRAMARLVQSGQIRAVGVSNFTTRQMEIAHDELAKFGIPLASNEVQVNLLYRKIESNGMLEAAQRLGVSLLAYSAQRQGLLTGKYHSDRSLIRSVHPLRRKVMGLTSSGLDRSAPLIRAMTEMAAAHQATVGQIALAWLLGYYQGVVIPIAGASKAHHAGDSAGALNVQLSADELGYLATISGQVTKT